MQIKDTKKYTEDEVKEIAWLAYMSRTDESEFYFIHRKEARPEFEKWWILNKTKFNKDLEIKK